MSWMISQELAHTQFSFSFELRDYAHRKTLPQMLSRKNLPQMLSRKCWPRIKRCGHINSVLWRFWTRQGILWPTKFILFLSPSFSVALSQMLNMPYTLQITHNIIMNKLIEITETVWIVKWNIFNFIIWWWCSGLYSDFGIWYIWDVPMLYSVYALIS